jgi:Na+/melibiose symporter-like transporter
MSMVSVPHLALGNELKGDTTQNRTAIYAWRSAMTLFGFLVGILVPAVLNASGIKLTRPELTFAGIIAVICLFATAVTLFSCRERSVDPTTIYPENSVKIRDLLRGKVGKLMLAFFIATFAQGLNSVLAMYYYRFTLALDDQAIGKILIVFVLTLCATIPFWVSGAKRVSKTTLIGYGTAALGIISSIAYPMFPAGQLNGPYLMAVVGGCLLGSSGLLESLLVDTAEDQKIEAGTLGVVFGLWKFMAKAARGIAIAFGGKLLAIIGYTPTSTPDSAVLVNIAWLFGPGVGVFFLLTGILLVFEKNKNSRV